MTRKPTLVEFKPITHPSSIPLKTATSKPSLLVESKSSPCYTQYLKIQTLTSAYIIGKPSKIAFNQSLEVSDIDDGIFQRVLLRRLEMNDNSWTLSIMNAFVTRYYIGS